MPRRPRLAKAFVATATYLRIATYTRRSTDEENQPFTIEAQDTKLDAYATSQDGWNIVAKFSDDASGASVDRPGLERAIAAAKAGKFDVLLVYRVDRFSRRIRDLVWLLDELDQAGVVFRSATEPFDTSTPAGRMLVQMLGVFAEFEREMIIDRVINGMERKASKGQWTVGYAPFGYRVDKATQHLVPVEEELQDRHRRVGQPGLRRLGGVPRHPRRRRPPRHHQPRHLHPRPRHPHRARRAPRQVRGRRLRLPPHRQDPLPTLRTGIPRHVGHRQTQPVPLLHLLHPQPVRHLALRRTRACKPTCSTNPSYTPSASSTATVPT